MCDFLIPFLRPADSKSEVSIYYYTSHYFICTIDCEIADYLYPFPIYGAQISSEYREIQTLIKF